MKASEVLRLARQRIERPEAWTREVFARDANGVQCALRDSKARQWCLVGATELALDGMIYPETIDSYDCLERALEATGETSGLVVWQDQAQHRDVLALLDHAIALAEADEALP